MTREHSPPRQRARVDDTEADAVLAACRVLVALSAQSIAAVEDVADVAQVRALVVISSRGSVSLRELADAANLHLTRASRLCDRMVAAGLVDRAEDPANRRQVTLTLTTDGHRVVHDVMTHRRAAIIPILARLEPRRRADLVAVLQDFAAAGGEPTEPDLWAMGWTT
ncbi:MarR family transcriptional regulator [Mycolicibacterium sp. P1-18]|uniref:MarR family winged helix-turn-helix transcriptional regulator n=1 Tax=Mycolicibacterium sp. P1-18 TaxID=2024615 RepID=UPI0011F10D82|nr:MarR family winged helix-turn-helix transcriptional regulator [Mycolicibacterium sp. P1-18]KAA0101024.1 MarR family transcriptional regulator [Mycolicibacterium sp. P1-18]